MLAAIGPLRFSAAWPTHIRPSNSPPPWTRWSPRSRPTAASWRRSSAAASPTHGLGEIHIDVVLVTIDDKAIAVSDLPLYADGVNVHASLIPRAEFRKIVEGATQNSFMHSLLAKGRLLYTHDETLEALCARLHQLGDRDRDLQMLRAASAALYMLYKARKWFLIRGDLDYTALWLLYAATPLAKIEVIGAGRIADCEVIPQAAALNPPFFRIVYSGLLNAKKTRTAVEAALEAAEGYLTPRLGTLFAPVIDHLREVERRVPAGTSTIISAATSTSRAWSTRASTWRTTG